MRSSAHKWIVFFVCVCVRLGLIVSQAVHVILGSVAELGGIVDTGTPTESF